MALPVSLPPRRPYWTFDFNANLEAESILREAEYPVDNRKHFHALMSGGGSGKTRTLCEIRAELLKIHFHSFPIAITFNGPWRTESGDAREMSTRVDLTLEIEIHIPFERKKFSKDHLW